MVGALQLKFTSLDAWLWGGLLCGRHDANMYKKSPIVTNYRTYIDDLYKVLEFVEWYKEWY